MPVYSMTGYASAAVELGAAQGSVNIEARSVNGRFLDLNLRLTDELRGLEPALRELLAAACRRGKVEVRGGTTRGSDDAMPQPAAEQLNRLAALQNTVQAWLPQARALSVAEVLALCRGAAAAGDIEAPAMQAARRCVEALREARAREGARLAAALTERTARLRELARQAAPLVPAVVQRQQQRFQERWREALAAAQGSGPPLASIPESTLHERALAEAAAHALRIDVAEELTRLNSHLDEIDRLLAQGGELGKRLDFLVQELHREANTLGSKSAAMELTAIAVDMKVLIEQMREQVQNIE
ncbi:MAG: YicC family protein [Rubrivivax sp.]|nr:YicC family protein [Rubrivivax sp.]